MISLEKLRRWTHYETADRDEAKETHYEIRANLEMGGLRGVDEGLGFVTRLQGSYRNTTMVYDSGDVDILVIRTDAYHGDFTDAPMNTDTLAPVRNPKEAFEEHAEGVYRTLQAQYGTSNVDREEKAIEVDTEELPLGADVVPCLQYRKFWSNHAGNHMKGIVFWTTEGKKIVNYPRRHRKEGIDINDRTGGNYKETIRVFKNFRNTLVEEGEITKDGVPSYYIECLLSNVSESIIASNDLRERVEGILDELEEDANENFPEYTVQHGMDPLFGEDVTQWNMDHAKQFIRKSNRYYWDS